MDVVYNGFKLMGYGLLGVFIVLIIFYVSIKILVRLFPQ